MTTVIIATLLTTACVGVLIFVYRKNNSNQMNQLTTDIHNQTQTIFSSLLKLEERISDKLSENSTQFQKTQGNIIQHADSTAKLLSDVSTNLGKTFEATKQLMEIGKSISGLESLLKAPKTRGGMGEFFLEEILSQCFPKALYKIQTQLSNGKIVDALIQTKEGYIPIDSKFPLENFNRIVSATSDDERKTYHQLFMNDIKAHVKAIKEKYLTSRDGLLDFAFMYIPAESVYYELITNTTYASSEKSLFTYCVENRVYPVSPMTFYSYLQMIIYGLKGYQIEESAKKIRSDLKNLLSQLDGIRKDFVILTKHLENTFNTFHKTSQKLDKFSQTIQSIHSIDESDMSMITPSPRIESVDADTITTV